MGLGIGSCCCGGCCSSCFTEASVAWTASGDWGNTTLEDAANCNPPSYTNIASPCTLASTDPCDWCTGIGSGPFIANSVSGLSNPTLGTALQSHFGNLLTISCNPAFLSTVTLKCCVTDSIGGCTLCKGIPLTCCVPGSWSFGWLVAVGQDSADGKCYLYAVLDWRFYQQSSISPFCNYAGSPMDGRVFYRSAEITDKNCCTTLTLSVYSTTCAANNPCDSYPATVDVTTTC